MKKKCDLLYQLDFAQKYAIFNRDIQDGIKNIVEALKKGYLTREQCQTLLYLESFRLERCQARTGRAQRNPIFIAISAWLQKYQHRLKYNISFYQQDWLIIKSSIAKNLKRILA